MTPTASSPQSASLKRAYAPDEPTRQPDSNALQPGCSPPRTSSSATSAFRNVSACNRCRVRKNRCDQRLPACSTCIKANARCVGYDPITKREIPRSYVYFLETRLAYFEQLLNAHGIPFAAADVYSAESKHLGDGAQSPAEAKSSVVAARSPDASSAQPIRTGKNDQENDDDKLNDLVSNIGMVSVQGASDARYLGSTSGISFARVVLAAVKSSVSNNSNERPANRPSRPVSNVASSTGSSMRESYFGLQTKPTIQEAPFPDRDLGWKLANLYFEHANPQIPILHRGDFLELFERTYSTEPSRRTAHDLYCLNIVFAIGAGIIWGSSDPHPTSQQADHTSKRPRLSNQQAQPEEYHASAIVHLGSFLGSSPGDVGERHSGDLEELQAVLLLAGFALLRPVAPGLWYIVGVAMRLAVDLGLHYEDGSDIEDVAEGRQGAGALPGRASGRPARTLDAKEKGRREWIRDLRRRLWWCTYTFDRLVSTCVGRPFGITDQVVTTEFPSLLDDKYITKQGFLSAKSQDEPTYKRVAHHYFRLRLLQSEILQVLQHQQAQQARMTGANRGNRFMHTKLPSPFLSRFDSFRSWRRDIDQRLYEWKVSAPEPHETGVGFSVRFLELNYWQAVIMLYRQSLSVPAQLAHEVSPTEEVSSPASIRTEEKEDEDLVFLKCAEAGQKTLKLYRQLHRLRLVNYTYLATHHLFMAGISFLYAVWHSPAVRARLTLDDFDFTVLAATSVLGDLMEKCPPAEACRDAFERMSKATVQMCMTTPGFGLSMDREESSYTRPPGQSNHSQQQSSGGGNGNRNTTNVVDPMQSDVSQPLTAKAQFRARHMPVKKRPPPKFDMDLRDLFPDDLDSSARPSQSIPQPFQAAPRSRRQQQQQPLLPHKVPQGQQQRTSPPQRHMMSSTSSINPQFINSSGIGSTLGPPPLPPQGGAFGPGFSLAPSGSATSNSVLATTTANDSDHLASQQTQPQPQQPQQPQPRSPLLHSEQEQPLYMQKTYNQDFISSSAPPGMDFINDLVSGGDDGPVVDRDRDAPFDIDLDAGGLDLGFGFGMGGLGLDFQHDWSDGQQYDLFDGFFFGGNGNGNGGGGGGNPLG
ncbi:Positive regulator of purine utilization [Exophiala dermatitidis]